MKLEGGWTPWRWASEDAGSRRGWIVSSHIDWRENKCTLGPERGSIVRFNIDWRGKRLSARMLGLEGGWIVRSHIGWRRERNIPYKGVEISP